MSEIERLLSMAVLRAQAAEATVERLLREAEERGRAIAEERAKAEAARSVRHEVEIAGGALAAAVQPSHDDRATIPHDGACSVCAALTAWKAATG